MEGHDFDKLFGSKLPDLADKNWSKLETKLEKFNLERKLARLIGALWGLGGLNGLLLGITGVLYYQSSLHEEQISSLKRHIASKSHHSYLKADTIYRKVILYDTIYQTVSIQSKKAVKERTFNDVSTHEYPKMVTETLDVENDEVNNTEHQKVYDLTALNGKNTVFNSIKANLSPFESYNEVDSSETKTTFSLKPASINIGLIAGYGQLDGDLFDTGEGLHTGIRTHFGYNNRLGKERWGIILDVQKNFSSFEHTENNRKKNRTPNNLPSFTDSRLKDAYVKDFAAYQVGIGFRYNFLFSKKLIPYFGVNWAIQLPSYYTIHYSLDASNNQDPEDYDKIYTTNLDAILNIWGANIGLNYQFSSRISTGMEAYFQSQLSQDLITPNVLGGRLGFYYHFGKEN